MPESLEFVDRFESAWSKSDSDALAALLTEDVVLIQPMMAKTVGKAAAREQFSRLFQVIPDLHVIVHRSAAQGEVLFIEFTLNGTLAGREVSWPAVDRFLLRDGLAAERISYFDPLPLGFTIMRRPRAWRRMISSRLRLSLASIGNSRTEE